MFSSISWQDFLTTAALVVVGYYLVTILIFYFHDIVFWFNGRHKSKTALPTQPQPTNNLMGKVQPEPVRPIRKQTVEADAFLVEGSTDDEGEEPITDTKILTGSVADLLQEIKTLGEMIAENHSPAEDGIPLFKSLLEHYPQVRDSPFREAVTIVIHTACKDTCQYQVELSEVKSWWDNPV